MASPYLYSPQSHARGPFRTILVIAGVVCLALLVFSRSPDLLLTARFFAEDGKVFYAQAHDIGFLHSLVVPYAGYLHLFPRLIAGVSLWLPLFYVPLLFNTAALMVQCITTIYLCSSRLRNAAPLRVRLVAAFLYLGLPHIGEVWGKLTNSHWHLAVLSFLILIAAPPEGRSGKWFDRVALVVGALSGPFCMLLLPVALMVAVYRRSSRTITNLSILAAGAAIQAIPLLIIGRPTENARLGASFLLMGKLLIRWLLLDVLPHPTDAPLYIRYVGAFFLVAGAVLAGWILWKGSLEMRCLVLFGATLTAASLGSPITVTNGEQWPAMLLGAGERYWFLPKLVLAIILLWAAVQGSKWMRAGGFPVLLGLLVCCVAGWHIAQWKGVHFRAYIHVFDALPVGAQLTFPIDPPPWTMVLTKTARDPSSVDPAYEDGAVLRVDALPDRPRGVNTGPISAAVGQVLFVNGATVGTLGTGAAPVRVRISAGALLEGWMVSDEATTRPLYPIYAVISDHIVRGDRLPLPGSYRGKKLENAMYLVFIPSKLLRPGPQEISIMGYSREDDTLRTCGQALYIYGQ